MLLLFQGGPNGHQAKVRQVKVRQDQNLGVFVGENSTLECLKVTAILRKEWVVPTGFIWKGKVNSNQRGHLPLSVNHIEYADDILIPK